MHFSCLDWRPRQRETLFAVPPVHALMGGFLRVPLPGTEPKTLVCWDSALTTGLPGQARPPFLAVLQRFHTGPASCSAGFLWYCIRETTAGPMPLTVSSLIHSALSSVQVWGRVRRHSCAWTSRRPSLLAGKAVSPLSGLGRLWDQLPRTGLISGLTCTGLRPAGPEVSGEVRAGFVLGLLHFCINLRQLVNSCKGAVGARQEWHQACCGCGAAVLSAGTVRATAGHLGLRAFSPTFLG